MILIYSAIFFKVAGWEEHSLSQFFKNKNIIFCREKMHFKFTEANCNIVTTEQNRTPFDAVTSLFQNSFATYPLKTSPRLFGKLRTTWKPLAGHKGVANWSPRVLLRPLKRQSIWEYQPNHKTTVSTVKLCALTHTIQWGCPLTTACTSAYCILLWMILFKWWREWQFAHSSEHENRDTQTHLWLSTSTAVAMPMLLVSFG